jgi:hypothetical protein
VAFDDDGLMVNIEQYMLVMMQMTIVRWRYMIGYAMFE